MRLKVTTASLILSVLAHHSFLIATTTPPSRKVHHTTHATHTTHVTHLPHVTETTHVAYMTKTAYAKRAQPLRRTWQTGPASMPPETEVISSRTPASPPRTAAVMASRTPVMPAKSTGRSAVVVRPVRYATVTSVGVTRQAAAVEPKPVESPEPEDQRVQAEFMRLRQDDAARRAFYEDMLRTVERVRTGRRDDDTVVEKPVSYQTPAKTPDGSISEPDDRSHTPLTIIPEEPPSPKQLPPQSSIGPTGSSIDQVAYKRVIRWAKANDMPIALALGVAWMESRLNTNAPRGTSGEVGMFQIMPERCRLEGWPPERLREPEFNAWMGTTLLARYYREEGSISRAAAKYVAGPGVFNRTYSKDMWAYINWYATTVDTYASYFSRVQS